MRRKGPSGRLKASLLHARTRPIPASPKASRCPLPGPPAMMRSPLKDGVLWGKASSATRWRTRLNFSARPVTPRKVRNHRPMPRPQPFLSCLISAPFISTWLLRPITLEKDVMIPSSDSSVRITKRWPSREPGTKAKSEQPCSSETSR